MNASSFLVMLIVGLSLAAGGAFVFLQNASTLQQVDSDISASASVRLVGVDSVNNTNNSIRYVRIQVTSDQPVRVDDAQIMLKTNQDVAYLQYRNGSLTRNVSGGFYTS